MNIPLKSGKTSLAYVTNEERKLLRRRDAVKGSPNKKTTHGIPRLEGGGDYDRMLDAAAAKEIRAKEDALKEAGFKLYEVGDYSSEYEWIHPGKKLSGGSPGGPVVPTVRAKPYSVPSAEWGAFKPTPAPKEESKPAPTPAPTPAPKVTPKLDTTKAAAVTVAPTAPPPPPPPPPAPETPSVNATIDQTQLQQPMLDEIVADGLNSELLETRLKNLINQNNPLFKAATTKAMQAMAARGLVNSSIAEEAVMNAILSVAMPIAERDATAYMNQRMQNQTYSNQFRTQQNQAYYAQFLQKLQHSMEMAMKQLTERSANWRAVLAQRGSIATTPKMSTKATEAAMGAVTPNWWSQ